jgi:acetyl-CoA carboxylase beta subunit
MAWTRFGKKKEMPGGLWTKCESCGSMLFRKDFEAKNRVCDTCGHHFTLPARERIALTADPGSFTELYPEMMRRDRSHDRRHVHDQGAAGGARGDELLVPRRLDGNGGRRESGAGDRGGDAAPRPR